MAQPDHRPASEPSPDLSPPDADVTGRPLQPDASGSSDKREEGAEVSPKKPVNKRTAFYITSVVIALILLAAAVMEPLIAVLRYILSVLSPLIIGAIIAYLCDPILEMYEFRVFRRMRNGGSKRGLSLFCTIITAFGILALVVVMMLPQFLKSLNELFSNYERYLDSFLGWLQSFIDRLPVEMDISDTEKLKTFLLDIFGSAENAVSQFIDKLQALTSDANFWEKLGTFFVGLFNSFKNLFIGLFIAFYLLASKEKRVAQFAKLRRALCKPRQREKLEEIIALVDETFSGFIYGKILDSCVIGVLTFLLLTIFEISPYNMLIATFVGVTNIIPVFGPFIGAIPAFFIVLISNPTKAFLFLVLILLIQQIDGNFIGPKILGDNTGVSSLCVIIAIAVCSTLWGFVGMIIGVPIFAVVIELVKRFLEGRLQAQGDPTDTLAYYPHNAIGNAEQDVYYEHTGLRYKYERSRLKPRVDSLRHSLLGHLGRQNSASLPSLTDTADPPDAADPPADPMSPPPADSQD